MSDTVWSCVTCRFASPVIMPLDHDGADAPNPVVECRRYPPQFVAVDGEPVIGWPQVNADDWCGEYKATAVRLTLEPWP
jgi:hypothetical protein